jgi:hypothetical protein
MFMQEKEELNLKRCLQFIEDYSLKLQLGHKD